jgi:multiple sugar transport system permease protein
MASVSVLEGGRSALGRRSFLRTLRGGLHGSEYAWAVAFIVPYIVVFLAFVVYPVAYGFWLGSEPHLYIDLLEDPVYRMTVVNTLLYVGIGVNTRMFIALLLSGFFMRPGWWVKGLLMIFVLPWAVPVLPTYISIHWMMNGDYGLLNNALWTFFHINGLAWLDTRWLALGTAIMSYIWKWTPFWTVILLAGRMAIPSEIREAAKVDGCTGVRSFVYITCPMIGNLYLVCTLLGTMFTLGDFNTIYFITGGGPAMSTYVLANLGIRNAFDLANPRLGVAAVLTALPVVIPLVFLLMRKLKSAQVEL